MLLQRRVSCLSSKRPVTKTCRWCNPGGSQYCKSPTCQIDYGPACDANLRPKGPDTANIARPKFGSVPYGQAIYDCKIDGGIALTFDDGPWTYTSDLLDMLAVRSLLSMARSPSLTRHRNTTPKQLFSSSAVT